MSEVAKLRRQKELNEKTYNTSLRISQELHERLVKASGKLGCKMTELTRAFIMDGLDGLEEDDDDG